jgi:hypothetical protein
LLRMPCMAVFLHRNHPQLCGVLQEVLGIFFSVDSVFVADGGKSVVALEPHERVQSSLGRLEVWLRVACT